MASPSSSRKVVYAAFAGNLLIAVTKFAAAAWTGSSAMLSEAIHSLVDTGNQILLLYGMRRAARPADEQHPLGHGRELYFWSFIVALLMFTLGAGVTFYEGVHHITNPHPIADPIVNYIVLGCSMLFEGATWLFALREFSKTKGEGSYYQALRRSKDPPAFIVLFEDSAALIGLLIAFAGTLAALWLAMPILDGVASIGISLVLAMTALLLARESKGLLLGEPASRQLRDSILKLARASAGIERADLAFTVHLAPDQIVAALSLEFADRLTTPDIEQVVLNVEKSIRQAHPEVVSVFIKPQTARTFQWRRGHILGRVS
jgi:cation diffusion facilitator family transporter